MTLLGWALLAAVLVSVVLGLLLSRARRLEAASTHRLERAKIALAAEKARANEYQAAETEAREVLRAIRDRHDADVAAIDDEVDAAEGLADEPGALADAWNEDFGNGDA